MTAAKRLIISIIGFSFLITLVSTSIQLYIDYQAELSAINDRFQEIEETRLPNLTHNVWVLDDEQIQLHLVSLVNSPYVEYAAISSEGNVRWLHGEISSNRTLEKTYPLELTNGNQAFDLGQLRVVAGLNPVFQTLRDRALVILGSNAVVIFLIAGFFLILFPVPDFSSLASLVQLCPFTEIRWANACFISSTQANCR